MSGIFLTVEETGSKPNESVLKATKGGYPHITLVYTGTHVPAVKLIDIGSAVVKTLAKSDHLEFSLPLNYAAVNEFFESKTGKQRYDVLLHLSDSGVKCIDDIRDACNLVKPEYSTNPPHVTHSIHYDKASAEAALASLASHAPSIVIRVTGFTFD